MTAKEMFEELGFTKEYVVDALKNKKAGIIYYVQNEEKEFSKPVYISSQTLLNKIKELKGDSSNE